MEPKTKMGLKWQLAYFGPKVGSMTTFLKLLTSIFEKILIVAEVTRL